MRAIASWLDRFCYNHPRFGIPGLMKWIAIGNVVVYVLDMAGTDGRSPIDDLHALKRELELYSPGLSDRARLIIANKMDADESRENLEAGKRDLSYS